jgi:hypothetical protein
MSDCRSVTILHYSCRTTEVLQYYTTHVGLLKCYSTTLLMSDCWSVTILHYWCRTAEVLRYYTTLVRLLKCYNTTLLMSDCWSVTVPHYLCLPCYSTTLRMPAVCIVGVQRVVTATAVLRVSAVLHVIKSSLVSTDMWVNVVRDQFCTRNACR